MYIITEDNNELKLNNIAFIGNYLPRICGIATFTKDLLTSISKEAPETFCWAVAMNDTPQGYSYPKEVRFELYDKRFSDYELAAEFLNLNKIDVVCLQHEFGIFGGESGQNILTLIRNLRIPIISTLHSLLPNPNLKQKRIIEEINRFSDKIVVMSNKAKIFLNEIYKVPNEKIELIHHGIPDLSFIDPNFFKDKFGVEGKTVILTFGLINPGKGIEFMIEALPEIVQKHSDIMYIVLGQTHPNLIKKEGEKYRHFLQRRARELGVENHILFYNRFVDLEELCEFLGTADIYVTPYINKEQIVSGTLAYALGAGNAIISTPYWYAEEILAEGRGCTVPFKNSKALAKSIINLLDNKNELHAMRKKAYSYSREMIWKQVAINYLNVFREVMMKRDSQPKSTIHKILLRTTPFEIPEPKFDHIYRLTDDVGILQHANYIVPNRDHGYCTDDNSRALIAVLMAQNLSLEDNNLKDLDCRYLSFILHSFNQELGRFRNFMGYDRRWLENKGSEDNHGRAVWSLGYAIGLAKTKEFGEISLEIFERAVESLANFNSPRSLAFGLVGIHAYLARFSGDSKVKRHRETIATKLLDLYKNNASPDWPWLENIVTYDNGKIPHALLMSGQWLQRGDMIEAGLNMLDWLIKIQMGVKGQFSPIGNNGWFSRGSEKARFDQQPIEAQSIIEASIEAYKITRDKKWITVAQRCFEWFLGRNDLSMSIYDYKTGGCNDGLTSTGVNRNQGAESTLAWLLSILNMYLLENIIDFNGKEEHYIIDKNV